MATWKQNVSFFGTRVPLFFLNAHYAVLLDLTEEMLPLGGNHWNELALAYNREVPEVYPRGVSRNAEALKRKFKALKNMSKPTGNPDCPPEVMRAKRLQYAIESKASIPTMDDDDSEEGEWQTQRDPVVDGSQQDEEEGMWVIFGTRVPLSPLLTLFYKRWHVF